MIYKSWYGKKFGLAQAFFHTRIYDVYLSLRRILLIKLNPKYVKESIAKRKGYCQFPQCDCCWKYCTYYMGYKKGCTIHENKPTDCRLYPIDPKDKIHSIENCTYYWDEEIIKLTKR